MEDYKRRDLYYGGLFVYYESMKRKLKIKPIYECRCNGRLQTKRFTRLAHTGLVVKLEDLNTIGDPSRLRTIRKAAALARARPTLFFRPEEKVARRK